MNDAPKHIVELGALNADDPRLLEAYRRERILLFVETLEAGWSARSRLVAKAIAEGDLRGEGPAPSRVTLSRWHQRWVKGDRQPGALIDLPSTGRPAEHIHAHLERYLLRVARSRPTRGPKKLHEDAAAFVAHSERLSRDDLPTRDRIRRWRNSRPVKERLLASYGTRAARAHAETKRTYPTERPNQLWQADETSIPVWARGFDKTLKTWFLAVVWAVVVRDHFSRAVLGWWVKDPTPENPFHSQFTAAEVLGVIAGAAIPELAHPAVRHLVRGDPEKVIVDGSGAMGAAKRELDKYGFGKHSMPYSPWQNGGIENRFLTLKKHELPDVVGSKVEWIPFAADLDPRTVRDRENFDPYSAQPKLLEVPLMALPRVEHIRAVFSYFMASRNAKPNRKIAGYTPEALFLKEAEFTRNHGPSRLIASFPTHHVQVTQNGVQVNHIDFQSDELQTAYPHKTKVLVRRDPLQRGVYVYPLSVSLRTRDTGMFVPRSDDWSRMLRPEQVHQAIRAETASMRDTIDDDRAAYAREVIGADAADALEEAHGKRDKKRRRTSTKAKKIEAAKAKKAQQELFGTTPESVPSEDMAQPISAGVPEFQVVPPAAAKRSGQPAAKVIPFTRPRRPAVVRLIDTSIAGSR